MPKYSQADRPMRVDTPLGDDDLLLEKLHGIEAISEPFRFELDLLAEAPVDFNLLMGQEATVTLALDNGAGRFVHGIIQALTMGGRVMGPDGRTTFIRYRAELVPELWLLTRRVQSRIFQHKSVRDILHRILHEEWQLEIDIRFQATYQPRNFCVQYRESDFAFVSRLMEEEGIAYFFQHEEERHVLVLADHAVKYTDLPEMKSVVFDDTEATTRREPRVRSWEKRQELRACRVMVRDYSFQMPSNNLTGVAELTPTTTLAAGKAGHLLGHQVITRDVKMLELYEYPGAFVQWHDGVPRGGSAQIDQQELQKIIADKDRMAKIRLDEEAAQTLRIRGGGDCGHFVPGFKFSLENHFDGESAGHAANVYLLTRLEQTATLEGVYTGPPGQVRFAYENHFECLPASLTYRPQRVTLKPRIDGAQTALVVGPPQAPAFLDQYGRVKVKFRWDRRSSSGAGSSCWVRVAQPWAGKRWGAFFWPRVGHEVVVTFEEGDPDRPLIVGSVYNAENMPALSPALHPASNGFKSCRLGGDPLTHFNTFVFHDDPGTEHVQIHSETHEVITSKKTKYGNTPGPNIQFNGSLSLPGSGGGGGWLDGEEDGEQGSGSGGGWLDGERPEPAVRGGGAVALDWGTLGRLLALQRGMESSSGAGGGWLEWAELGDVAKGKHSKLMQHMPGKSDYTFGESFDATIGAGRTSHIFGGGDVRLMFDLESLIEQGVSKLGAAGPALASLASLAFGVGGATDLLVGPAYNSTFFGPIYQTIFAHEYQYRWEEGVGEHDISDFKWKALIGLAVLTVATAMAGDIMARVKAKLKEPEGHGGGEHGGGGDHGGGAHGGGDHGGGAHGGGDHGGGHADEDDEDDDEEHPPAPTPAPAPAPEPPPSEGGEEHHAKDEVEEVPPWTTLLGVGLSGRLHAMLLLVETSFAAAQSGKKEADHIAHIVHSWHHIAEWLGLPEAKHWFKEKWHDFTEGVKRNAAAIMIVAALIATITLTLVMLMARKR